jgi:hypothetical protein
VYSSTTGGCELCPAGTWEFPDEFVDYTGFCYPCTPGFYGSSPGQGGCSYCPAGTFTSSSGSTKCTPCADNTIAPVAGTSVCMKCPRGLVTFDGIKCGDCPEGSVYSSAAGACERCPAGTFEYPGDEFPDAQGVCYPCSSGYYGEDTGQGGCRKCEAGTGSFDGKTKCTTGCVGNAVQPPGEDVCTKCKDGEVAYDGIRCGPCPEGYGYSSAAGGSCVICPAGTTGYPAGDRANTGYCYPCIAGTYSSNTGLGGGVCPKCPAGTYSSSTGSTKCTPCEANFVSPGTGSVQCTKCKEGAIAIDGIRCGPTNVTPKTCPEGSVYSSATGGCELCPAGTWEFPDEFVDYTGFCYPCTPGFYGSSPGQGGCSYCPAGTFTSSSGSTKCTPCADNTIAPVAGTSVCMKCPRGLVTFDGIKCGDCPEGSVYSSAAGACERCPAGTFEYPGDEFPDAQGVCYPCSSGYYGEDTGQGGCRKCEAGTGSFDGKTKCTTGCVGNAVQPPGEDVCTKCKDGEVAYDGIRCGPCPEGYGYSSAAGGSCVICPAGTTGYPAGDRANTGYCYPCIAGTYSSNTGLGGGVCPKCPAGTYSSSTGSTKCTPCEANFVSPGTGSVQCRKCKDGETTDDGLVCYKIPIPNTGPPLVLPTKTPSPTPYFFPGSRTIDPIPLPTRTPPPTVANTEPPLVLPTKTPSPTPYFFPGSRTIDPIPLPTRTPPPTTSPVATPPKPKPSPKPTKAPVTKAPVKPKPTRKPTKNPASRPSRRPIRNPAAIA